ncbi:helix-turn-helix domain-containing protein [Dehalogenimonas formicexedens]|uniref:helix-turn-helix domain-containing protein n=1 Tax=Dehalogenimonas formicexedens TaxID=1839801 RepID=UPI00096B7209
MNNDCSLVLTVTEAAKLLRLGRSLTYELCEKNALHGTAIRFGKRWLVSRSKLLRLIEGNQGRSEDVPSG